MLRRGIGRSDSEATATLARLRMARSALSPSSPAGAGQVGPQGPPGPKGVTWKGEWAAQTNYEEGDLVYLATDPGGSILTYFCLVDHTSLVTPGTYGPPEPGGTTEWHEISEGYLITDGSRPYVLDPTHTPAEGCLAWDTAQGLDRLMMDVAGSAGLVRVPVGGGCYIRCGNTGSAIPAGSPVKVSSTSSNLLILTLCTNSDALEDTVWRGVTMQAIGTDEEGWVCCRGYVGGLDLSGFAPGDKLYAGPAGEMLMAPPTRGCGIPIRFGVVIDAANPGTLFVEIEHRAMLDEGANVSIGDFASKAYFDVPMWLPPPVSEGNCDAWRDVPSARWPSVFIEPADSPYAVGLKDVIVLVTADSGDVEVDLPQINNTNGQGRRVTVKLIEGPYRAAIVASGGQTIDGVAETLYLLAPQESLDFQADSASGWRTV